MVSMEASKNARHEMNILRLLVQGKEEMAAGMGMNSKTCSEKLTIIGVT